MTTLIEQARDPHLAARLKQARRERGMTQEAVAGELGLARTSLVAIEKAQRNVQPDELLALSKLYAKAVDDLLRPSEPLSEFVAQFRTSLSRSDDSEPLEEAIRTVQAYAEDYRELERIAGAAPQRDYPRPYKIEGLGPDAAAESIATQERGRLGLGDGAIRNLREVLETKVGLWIFMVALPPKIEGFFAFTEQTGGCIAVNANRPAERQAWTLAHECGHFLTRRQQAEITVAGSYTRAPAHERFAEAFSRELLMPRQGLIRDFHELRQGDRGVTPAGLVELSSFYGVSFQALVVHLEGLGLLSRGTYDLLVHEHFKVNQARELLGIPVPEPDTRIFPQRYIRLAVDCYLRGDISEGAFARYLRLDRIAARKLANAVGAPLEQERD